MESGSLTDALRETLAIFDGSGRPWTTSEVAERLDLGRRSTYARLERLVEQDRLETKKVGANARVWWRPRPEASGVASRSNSPSTNGGVADAERSAVTGSLVDDILADVDVGIFVLDENFDVAWINAATERYFGIDHEQVVGRDKRRLIDEQIASVVEDAETFTETVLTTYDDNSYTERFECHVTASDRREERWLEHRSKPIDSGEYAGGRVEIYYDITDRKRSKRAHEEDRKQFESLVDAVEEYAIFPLDAEGHVQAWNAGAEQIKGYNTAEILGEHFSVFYPDDDRNAGVPEQNLEVAAEYGSVQEEGWRVRSDGSRFWANVTITSIHDGDGVLQGYTKVVRDMTGQREYERRLRAQAERLERQRDELRTELDEVIERISDGFIAVDEEWELTYLNSATVEMLDATEAELIGEELWDALPELVGADSEATYREAMKSQEPTSIEAYYEAFDGWYRDVVYPSTSGLSIYFRDVTDRKERERELARFERAVESSGHAIYMTDVDGEITYVNPAFEEITGYSREEAVGTRPRILQSGEHDDAYYRTLWETIRAGEVWEEEITDRRKNGEFYHAEQTIAPVIDERGEIDRFVAVQNDITERKRRQAELETRVRQQEVVTHLGHRALESDDLDALMAEASELVADTLDNDYCKVLELDADAEELLLRQGVGWDAGIVGEATVSSVEGDSQASYTLARSDPVVVENLETESRFGGPELLTSHDVTSGISTTIGPYGDPWGILGTHDTTSKSFSEQDVNFVQSVANILASAVEQREHERELVQRREQLEALNSLNEVVREITNAVIDHSTREEIEATVCEYLADSDSYLFAWTGAVDTNTQTVTARTEAGVDGYLDGVTISVDPDDERSEGPTGRAFRTGRIQTSQDIDVDPRHDPWREQIERYGFRSSAAVPIVHENTVYGVLNVYAERPYAFEGREQEMFTQLGEIVGHAITAAERKQALMSDELVELEFRIQDLFAALDAAIDTEGTVRVDSTVQVADEEFLVYGTATSGGIDIVHSLLEAVPHWESVTVLSGGDPISFELRLTSPPVLSVVASLGGYVDQAVIEDGTYRMTIHLAPTADVRRVIDTVQSAYPQAEMLSRRQITRPRDNPQHSRRRLVTDLTDRQRVALDVAYHAGFFEWPRETTGEDVAESMGVAPPTFHQHLRTAERKVFDSVFSPGRT